MLELGDAATAYQPLRRGNPYHPQMARIIRIYKMVEDNHLTCSRCAF
jgi:hypothetical protein